MTVTHILRRFGIGRSRPETQEVLVNGAINLADGFVYITKATAAAISLADPSLNSDGAMLHIVSETAAAHVITAATSGFNGKGSSGTATFGGAKGDGLSLIARNGKWWTVGGGRNVTLA